jgi:septal ring factor EnvC (AmiA/AmiB activator)
VANSYYELQALDNQLNCKTKYSASKKCFRIVKLQKKLQGTELAVQKFKAEVLKSQSMEYDINQNIKETENRINFY